MRKITLIILLLAQVNWATATDLESRIVARMQERIQRRACQIQLSERRIPLACEHLDPKALETHCLDAVAAADTSSEINHPANDLMSMPKNCREKLEERRQDLLYKERKSLNKLHSL